MIVLFIGVLRSKYFCVVVRNNNNSVPASAGTTFSKALISEQNFHRAFIAGCGANTKLQRDCFETANAPRCAVLDDADLGGEKIIDYLEYGFGWALVNPLWISGLTFFPLPILGRLAVSNFIVWGFVAHGMGTLGIGRARSVVRRLTRAIQSELSEVGSEISVLRVDELLPPHPIVFCLFFKGGSSTMSLYIKQVFSFCQRAFAGSNKEKL
jgi:hypothetical protein